MQPEKFAFKRFMESYPWGTSFVYDGMIPNFGCRKISDSVGKLNISPDFEKMRKYAESVCKRNMSLMGQKWEQIKGGSTMRGHGQFGALIEASKVVDEFQVVSVEAESQMVKDALALHAQQQKEAVSNEIVEVLKLVEIHKDNEIMTIRKARKTEAFAKKNLGKLDAALAFAKKTGNFCPLLRLMGVFVPDENIPAEFKE